MMVPSIISPSQMKDILLNIHPHCKNSDEALKVEKENTKRIHECFSVLNNGSYTFLPRCSLKQSFLNISPHDSFLPPTFFNPRKRDK